MKVVCFAYLVLLVLFSTSFGINSLSKSQKKIISIDDIDFEHVDLYEEASTVNTLKSKIMNSNRKSSHYDI